jgi:predicted nucleic acid-binding protein
VILVDTSVWIDHLRGSAAPLARLLDSRGVLAHPFVIGEIALGTPPKRDLLLQELRRLPTALPATHGEVLAMIERHALFGLGIGYVDAHLLAATRLTSGASLWTRDRRLLAAAERIALPLYEPS